MSWLLDPADTSDLDMQEGMQLCPGSETLQQQRSPFTSLLMNVCPLCLLSMPHTLNS